MTTHARPAVPDTASSGDFPMDTQFDSQRFESKFDRAFFRSARLFTSGFQKAFICGFFFGAAATTAVAFAFFFRS